MNFKRQITIFFALVVTSTSISMASFSALDRGGALSDKILLVVISATVAAFVHILPSLTKNKMVWLVWGGCLVMTVFSHVTFFQNAQDRAGEEHARKSLGTTDVERQIEFVTRARDTIVTRPVTTVTALLAVTQDWKVREQLKNELAEAKRAIELTNQLLALNEEVKRMHVTAGADRVTMLLSAGTKTSASQISVIFGVFLSCLIDFAGVMLWREIFVSGRSNISVTQDSITPVTQKGKSPAPVAELGNPVTSPEPNIQTQTKNQPMLSPDKTIQDLRQAVEAGICKPTIRAIRDFVSCGQARAIELKKQLGVTSQ